MNLKAIIQKIASWFKVEAAAVEQKVDSEETIVKTDIESELARITALIPEDSIKGLVMSTPATATPTTDAAKAIAIALALKEIDPSLTVDAIQAATAAAIAAAYPVAVAA